MAGRGAALAWRRSVRAMQKMAPAAEPHPFYYRLRKHAPQSAPHLPPWRRWGPVLRERLRVAEAPVSAPAPAPTSSRRDAASAVSAVERGTELLKDYAQLLLAIEEHERMLREGGWGVERDPNEQNRRVAAYCGLEMPMTPPPSAAAAAAAASPNSREQL